MIVVLSLKVAPYKADQEPARLRPELALDGLGVAEQNEAGHSTLVQLDLERSLLRKLWSKVWKLEL